MLRDRIEYAAANAYHPMAHGAIGDGSTNDAINLSKLWNTTMSMGGYCIIDRNYSIQSDLYAPNTVTLVFAPGGRLSVTPDVTITINGQVNAGLHQIFAGSGTVKFAHEGTPAVVYPQWWGARTTGATDADNITAINAAIASLETGHNELKGGVVWFTPGRWGLNGSIVVESNSITLQGAGQQNTQLDFRSAAVGNGIELRGVSWVKIRDLEVVRTPSHGIAMLGSQSGYRWWNNNEIESVRVEASAGHGVYLEHGFLGTFKNVFVSNSRKSGWRGIGFHTSCTFISCYANDNGSSGFDFGDPNTGKGIVYSSFISCVADNNAVHGYRLRGTYGAGLPVAGISFIACGSETNAGVGWFLDATAAEAAINGVTLINCFVVNNNTSAGWANLLYAKGDTAGTVIDQVTLIGCRAYAAGGGSTTVVAQGAGVRLAVDNCSFEHKPVAIDGALIYNRDAREAYSVSNSAVNRSYDANATTSTEIANVLGTLIADLRAKGIVG
jgi:hypothetical protein